MGSSQQHKNCLLKRCPGDIFKYIWKVASLTVRELVVCAQSRTRKTSCSCAQGLQRLTLTHAWVTWDKMSTFWWGLATHRLDCVEPFRLMYKTNYSWLIVNEPFLEDYGKIFLSVSIWTPNIAVRFQVDKPVSEFVEKKNTRQLSKKYTIQQLKQKG